jgi:hypothetical protein
MEQIYVPEEQFMTIPNPGCICRSAIVADTSVEGSEVLGLKMSCRRNRKSDEEPCYLVGRQIILFYSQLPLCMGFSNSLLLSQDLLQNT